MRVRRGKGKERRGRELKWEEGKRGKERMQVERRGVIEG